MRLFATRLPGLIAFCVDAHTNHPKKPDNAVRKHDGRTPYYTHPIGCAMMYLTETALSEAERVRGAEALLLHDIVEDTMVELPTDTPPAVVALVKEMTFASSAEEHALIFDRSIEAQRLKLYDKLWNMLDGNWMDAERRKTNRVYLPRLAREVERAHRGLELNIMNLVRAVCA